MLRMFHRCLSIFPERNAGLATLFAISFGCFGLVLTAGMAVLLERATSRDVQQDVEQKVAGIAAQMRDKLDRGMFERWRDIQIAASLDSIRNPDVSVDAKREVLTKLQTTYPDYAIIALVTPDGRVAATSNRLAEGSDVSKREYFIQGNTAPFVGDVHDAIVLAKLLPQRDGEVPRFLDVAAPILLTDGSSGGIVVAHLYWEWASDVQRSILKPQKEGTEVLIVARDGTVLLGPASLQGQRLDLDSIKTARAGESGAVQERWPDGRMYLTGFDQSLGYRDYPGLGWTVLVREELGAALAPARDLRESIAKASLFVALMIVLFSIVTARLITQPLSVLTAAAEDAQRSPAVRFPLTRGYAEVESLSHSLSALFDERERREQALSEAYDHARRNEVKASAREASFRLLFQVNPGPLFVFATDTLQFLAANEAALGFYGYDSETFLSMTFFDVCPSEERVPIRASIKTMGAAYDADHPRRHLLHDGTERQVLTSARRLTYDGRPAILVGVSDVTERLQAEAELRRTQELLSVIVEGMPAILAVKSAHDHRYVLINKAAEQLIGIPREKVLGKTDHDFFPKEQADFFVARDREVVRSGEVQIIPEQTIRTRANGERLLATKKLLLGNANGEPQFILIMSEDVTERRRAESRIAHIANHDALTGLPNRALFHKELMALVARIQTDPGSQVAVLYLDLDNFKNINETLGHALGDELLFVVSQRLKNCLREGDVVARLGGDEFGIIQTLRPKNGAVGELHALAQRILESMREPIQLHGNKILTGTSIGIAIASGNDVTAEQLLKNADMALYRAKGEDRGTYRFFESEMDIQIQERRSLEADLREAMANNEFEIAYQPLVHLSTGKITGVESLLRWRHPTRGMISPAAFIPLAEETKLIIPLGEWVLRQACAEVASWPAQIRLAVNLSAVQFKFADVPKIVASALASSGLSSARLEVEVTETMLLNEDGKTLAALQQLRTLGVRISMDDFGTGYSSLSYLRKYPFDKIKIDQSFVRELSSTPESQAIVRAVIGLAETLGMTNTAEGVETEEQLTLLRAAGCQEAQGYLFSRPKPAAEIRALIANWENYQFSRSGDELPTSKPPKYRVIN